MFTKQTYKSLIAAENLLDSGFWGWVWIYTSLYVFRTITDETRAIVGIVEAALGFAMVTILRNRSIIDAFTKQIIPFQIADLIFCLTTRFIVVSFPGVYYLCMTIRNNTVSNVTWTVFQDLENRLFKGKERTDLTLLQRQMGAAGSLIGSGTAFLTTGISIEIVTYSAAAVAVVYYIYEIWLLKMMKALVAVEES